MVQAWVYITCLEENGKFRGKERVLLAKNETKWPNGRILKNTIRLLKTLSLNGIFILVIGTKVIALNFFFNVYRLLYDCFIVWKYLTLIYVFYWLLVWKGCKLYFFDINLRVFIHFNPILFYSPWNLGIN